MYPFEFTREDIQEAVRSARLLALEIELGSGSGPRCPHCHVPRREKPGEPLSNREISDLILQARDLGARSIRVIDGEVEVHHRLSPIVGFARSQGLEAEVLTNGAGITEDVASGLLENRIPVVLRMDSLDEATQDALTGNEGSFELMQQAFRSLREAGYPSQEAALRVDTVICQQNLDEIVGIWRWLRAEGIVPRFEVAAPRANPGEKRWLHVDPARVQEIFAEITRIEREEYGGEWTPPPPRWGNGCMQHKFSCLVRWQGDVLPCVGVNICIGNIRDRGLAEIVQESEILEDLRDHGRTIKGPCASCEETVTCYGCRGAAYQWTGDYLATDPCCWRNNSEIIESLLPPMQEFIAFTISLEFYLCIEF